MELEQVDVIANFSAPPKVGSGDYDIQYSSAYLYGSVNSTLRSEDQVSCFSAARQFPSAPGGSHSSLLTKAMIFSSRWVSRDNACKVVLLAA